MFSRTWRAAQRHAPEEGVVAAAVLLDERSAARGEHRHAVDGGGGAVLQHHAVCDCIALPCYLHMCSKPGTWNCMRNP